MDESQVILGWRKRGEQQGSLEAQRAALLRVARTRLSGEVPEPIRLAVEGTNNCDQLNRWLDAAATCVSWDDLSQVMKVSGKPRCYRHDHRTPNVSPE